MRQWKTAVVEPSLDELLGDEMMVQVMRSAGVDAGGLRSLLAELAERVPVDTVRQHCECPA
jgi:hypothetical protein